MSDDPVTEGLERMGELYMPLPPDALDWARTRLAEAPNGRVLDHTALDGFARGSRLTRAMIHMALVEDVPLVIPSSALMIGWSRRGSSYEVKALKTVLNLPVVEIEDLDTTSAYHSARLPAIRDDHLTDFATAHVVHVARSRGWRVLSTNVGDIHRIARDVEVDEGEE